ncbi:MAG TPA: hypothetical protein VK174_08335 [Chitinophagales bacterium]|nr:hypothetical protein [Chitinophagales bacterium]
MKAPIYLSLIIGLLFIASCSKKDEDKQLTYFDPTTTKVKSVTYGSNNQTYSYTYNTSGLVESIQVSDGSRSTFNYDSVSVTQTNYNTAGAVISINRLELNSLGLAIHAALTDGGGTLLSTTEYTYDSNKHKTSELTYNANNTLSAKTEYAWYGGDDLLNYSIFDSTNTNSTYSYFQTYFDGPTSLGSVFTGQTYLGTDTKSLVRKSLRYSSLYGDYVQEFEYVLDGLQRVSQVKTFDRNGNLKNTDSYTYY